MKNKIRDYISEITIALIALTIVFFGGYFAAFALAHEKYLQTEAELSICRSSIESSRKEIATLKDSVDVLNRRLAEQVQTVSVQSEADINH